MRILTSPVDDLNGLMGEVRRYLAAVDLFRAEGLEPRWEPERVPTPPTGRRKGLVPARLDHG
jgi:hypothetical protein